MPNAPTRDRPEDLSLLFTIKRVLERLMADPGTGVYVDVAELYDHARRKSPVAKAFPSAKALSRFLRTQHEKGILKQVIPHYSENVFNDAQFDVRFHRERGTMGTGPKARTVKSLKIDSDRKRTVVTASGVRVRSQQERLIHDALCMVGHFIVEYEFLLTDFGSAKDVDFKITNTLTGKVFHWEHFGMTNNEHYKDGVARKLEWFRSNGFRMVEEGGDLIVTYYTSEHALQSAVQRYLTVMGSSG